MEGKRKEKGEPGKRGGGGFRIPTPGVLGWLGIWGHCLAVERKKKRGLWSFFSTRWWWR